MVGYMRVETWWFRGQKASVLPMHNAMKMARGRILEGDMVNWWWMLVERLRRVTWNRKTES